MPTRRNPKPSPQAKTPEITVVPAETAQTNVRNTNGKGSTGASGALGESSVVGEGGAIASVEALQTGREEKRGIRLSLANREIVLTRRHFLYGAAGVGAAAAVAVGARALGQSGAESDEIATLEVAEDHVFTHEECTEVPAEYLLRLVGDFTLPYGSLVWVNDDTWAACLLPTETPSPLTSMALLSLESGDYITLLDGAVGASDGFEVYDMRATSEGVVWTEANIFEERWRVYCAALDAELMLSGAVLLEEGDSSIETPTIAAVGDYAFWQTMPQAASEDARRGPAFIRRAKFNAIQPETVFESKGRFAAPLYACEDAIVFAPRHDDSSYYFRLVHMDASSKAIRDQLTLPQGMQPNQLGYGPHGFAFGFDAIYENGTGIANLGTYTPATEHDAKQYNDIEWFRFARTPLACPAWCTHEFLLVKSTKSVCAINLANRTYCAIDITDGSADWGDYLVTSGTHGTFVTSMQIDYTDTAGETTHKTQVRVWQPIPAEDRSSYEELLQRAKSGYTDETDSSEDQDDAYTENDYDSYDDDGDAEEITA